MKIEAVIFDMDGLIIDSEPLWIQGEHEVFASLGIDTTRVTLPETLGLRIDEVVALWYRHTPWQGVSQQTVAQRIIERVIALVHEKQPLLPGVIEALSLCQQLGLKTALASASPPDFLYQVLQRFHLQEAFDVISSAASLPYSKPHPEVYLQTAQRLGISPLACVTLEDSFYGMIATKAARMRSIVIPAAQHYADPRWVLADVKRASLHQVTDSDLCPYNRP